MGKDKATILPPSWQRAAWNFIPLGLLFAGIAVSWGFLMVGRNKSNKVD